MKRFILLVVIAVLASAPAVVLKGMGFRPGPLVDAAIFGVAILAAVSLLSWSTEAAERHIAQGLDRPAMRRAGSGAACFQARARFSSY